MKLFLVKQDETGFIFMYLSGVYYYSLVLYIQYFIL